MSLGARAKKQSLQFLATTIIGLTAGLAAVAFHQTILWMAGWLVEAPSKQPWWLFALFVIPSMAFAAWLTGWLMRRFAPDAPGSGIPQVKVAYHQEKLTFSWRLIWVKFVGGALSIGSGSSLGREGPTIHMGAALASKVAGMFKEDPAARANAVCAGSAAGLAAAFSSPIAGVTLVLEEIAGGANQNKFAGRSLLAAALASLVVYTMTGGAANLPVGPDMPMSWKVLWLSPVVGLAAGLVGVIFQWLTLEIRRRTKLSSLGTPARLAFGAAAAGVFAVAAYALTGHRGAFGLGEDDMLAALQNQIVWPVALCLLVAKLLATATSYGSGGCGGIFAPIIFFGCMTGVMIHSLAAPFLGLSAQEQTLLALVGMTACLAGVVRAPLTSILIVVEMTWQIHILPALMVAAVIGVYLNRTFFAANFYDAALRQDGIELKD